MPSRNTKIFDEIQGLLSSITEQDARDRIAEIDQQIAALQEERGKWGSLLVLKHQLGEATRESSSEDQPTMREAIRRVLEDQPPGVALKLARIGEEIIQRGWMEEVPKDWQRLQMMASMMKRKGQLERPRTGFYRLPPKDSEPEGEGQEE
ncbi:MAG TPA: hypothetical protein VHF50_01440 [Solirubrobacterales bacterium]|nr:hypothetical protein [Solirubrobacterales bacterium]